EGTYFITADFRPLGFNGKDVVFCRHITTEAGVAAVPVSAFYDSGHVDHFARVCFCKEEASLTEAIKRLRGHFGNCRFHAFASKDGVLWRAIVCWLEHQIVYLRVLDSRPFSRPDISMAS